MERVPKSLEFGDDLESKDRGEKATAEEHLIKGTDEVVAAVKKRKFVGGSSRQAKVRREDPLAELDTWVWELAEASKVRLAMLEDFSQGVKGLSFSLGSGQSLNAQGYGKND